ncbi:MAG: TatD family hydrolase [Syntrophomonadaceae bacterium]|nr:TatD family hydrolase [Syntrophomonadaceae bacterium]
MKRDQNSVKVIDSHAHLQDPRFASDVDQVIERACEGGVEMMICVGYDLQSSRDALALAGRYPQIRVVAGVHPHDAKSMNDQVLSELWELGSDPKVVAIGEMGLDFYRNLSPVEDQKKAFRAQIKLAQELRKPIVIHDRDAHAQVLSIIKEEKAGSNGGIMHCYSGHLPLAIELIKEGFAISFAGPLTYSNAKKSVETATRLPINKILIETDCPYLAPQSHRGKRNEPLWVWEVAKKLAECQKKSLEEVAYITANNTRQVFRI